MHTGKLNNVHICFYSFLSTVVFVRELLEPGGSMDEFERPWTSIEQINLESTKIIAGPDL